MQEIIKYFENLESQIAAANAKSAEQEARIAALEQALKEKDAQISALEQKVNEVEHTLSEIEIIEEIEEVEETPAPAQEKEPEPVQEQIIEPEPEIPLEPEPVAEPETVAEPEPAVEPEKAAVVEEPAPAKETTSPNAAIYGKAVDDIRQAISLGDRFLYQRELFNQNAELMQRTLNDINALSSFDEAVAYFNSHFQWDTESNTYQQFLVTLHRRFG